MDVGFPKGSSMIVFRVKTLVFDRLTNNQFILCAVILH